MEGDCHWLVRWALHAGTMYFCPDLAALAGPKQNIFFLAIAMADAKIPQANKG